MSAIKSREIAKLSLVPLIGAMYFSVCGGTYGLEGVVSEGGAFRALLLMALLPFFWALPIALVVAELSSAMPYEGGAYAWARESLGEFWGSQAGWWALCQGIADMALYPVLFVQYLRWIAPGLGLEQPLNAWLTATAVIAIAFALNVAGVRTVGRTAVVSLVLVLAPLLVTAAIVLPHDDAFHRVAQAAQPAS